MNAKTPPSEEAIKLMKVMEECDLKILDISQEADLKLLKIIEKIMKINTVLFGISFFLILTLFLTKQHANNNIGNTR